MYPLLAWILVAGGSPRRELASDCSKLLTDPSAVEEGLDGCLDQLLAKCVNRQKAGLLPLRQIDLGQWRNIQPGGATACSQGNFSFFVRRGSSNNVVVSFMGGGACWSGHTCNRDDTSFRISESLTRMDCMSEEAVAILLRDSGGIIDQKLPGNPVKVMFFEIFHSENGSSFYLVFIPILDFRILHTSLCLTALKIYTLATAPWSINWQITLRKL